MSLDLSDQIVLVTGASRGIGRAIAQQCAAAGATVAVHYGQSADAAADVAVRCGPTAQPFQADLTALDATEALVAQVLRAYGRLDALVLNAGVARSMPLAAPTEAWAADWNDTMHVNLRAPELLCRAALPHFQAQGHGRIVGIASRAAFRGDVPDYMAYAASKAGLVALMRSLARGFGSDGIKAFTVAPGFVRTDMAQAFIDQFGEGIVRDDLSLNELTEPEDVAPLVAFLLSGGADHATGTTIDINAGSYVH